MKRTSFLGLSLLIASCLTAAPVPPSGGLLSEDAMRQHNPRGDRPISYKSLSGATFTTWMSSWEEDEDDGYYTFDTDGSYRLKWTNIFTDYGINLMNAWMRNDRLCGLGVYNMGGVIIYYNYVEFEPATGQMLKEESVGPDDTIEMTSYYESCAYVPDQDRIYGFTRTDDARIFNFCWSPADKIGDVHVVRQLDYSGDRANALCYSTVDNTLYGVTFDGEFVNITFDGEISKIFTIPLEHVRSSKAALAYSPYDGCFLYTPAYYEDNTQLYHIYPYEQKMRLIRDFPGLYEFFFLINDDYTYEPDAPASPKLLTDTLLPPALEGIVTVQLPAYTASGNPLTGGLEWRLYIDNTSVTSGYAQPGAEVEIPVGPLEQGEHVLRVSCIDEAGLESSPLVINRFFGNGVPLAPSEVTMTETTVSWAPVTEAVLDGYLEPGKMQYDVYINDRFIGSTAETSMGITLDAEMEVTAYYAYVAANCNSQISERTRSNKVVYGVPFQLPYTLKPTKAQAEICDTFNNDGSPDYGTWQYWEYRWYGDVFASGWSYEKADDWLILPPVDCPDLSHAYRVTLEAICGGSPGVGDDERFEVWCGNAPTPEAMNTLAIPETKVANFIEEGWETFSNLFIPKTAGKTYVAIRAVSPPNQYSLVVRNITIEATDELADVPAAPVGFTVTGKSDADLTADVTFTMPTETIAGSVIDADADLKVKVGVGEEWTERSAKPGEKVMLTVKTFQGDNRIKAYCMLNGQAGQETSATVFTGTIPPNFIENFTNEVSRDNMSIHLTWEPPLGGQENLEGYYSPEGLHYWLMEVVVDPEYGDSSWEPTKDLGDVLEYTYTVPEGSPLTIKYLGIAAANNGGISDAIWYAYSEIGTPYKPEIVEDFDQGREPGPTYVPLRTIKVDESYDSSWDLMSPEDLGDELWNPDVPYALINYTNGEDATKGRLELPKFSTEGVKDPGLTLTIWTSEPCDGKISVYASTYGAKRMQKIFDVPQLYDGWQNIVIPMPELYCDMPWIQLALDTELPDFYTYVLLGGYRFGTVDIDGVNVPGNVPCVLFGGMGEVVALGFEGEAVSVCSLDGRTVARSDSASADLRLKVAPGIYVVKAGDVTRKVIVR